MLSMWAAGAGVLGSNAGGNSGGFFPRIGTRTAVCVDLVAVLPVCLTLLAFCSTY